MMFKKKEMRKENAWIVCGIVFLLVTITGWFAWKQLQKYEKGILEVYALQQDGYVQLVLDQINLQAERENEEIIQDILGTLDASNSRYWTLSEIDSIVFIKDIMETNRYKGFTTKTYYESYSAENFIESLQEGRVTHSEIMVENRKYIASGVQFAYNNKNYYMCLLTSSDTILDQNEYLGAKTSLCMLVIVALAEVFCGGVLLSILAERWYRRYRNEKWEKESCVATIEKLNAALSKDNLYHPRYMAFSVNALPMLLKKLSQRNVFPLEMMILGCPEGEQREAFMESAKIYFGEKTFKVVLDDRYLAVFSLRQELREEESAREEMQRMGAGLLARRQIEDGKGSSLEQMFANMWKEVQEHGC